MNDMETSKTPGRGSWVRDAVLLAAFAGVVGWSLFFTVGRRGPGAAGPAASAGAAVYRGELTIRAARLPEAAWPAVRAGDAMGTIATVTRTAVRDFGPGRRELHVTLKVAGPIPFTTERYPFPQQILPLRIGSLVWFETGRYTIIGDVIAMNP